MNHTHLNYLKASSALTLTHTLTHRGVISKQMKKPKENKRLKAFEILMEKKDTRRNNTGHNHFKE